MANHVGEKFGKQKVVIDGETYENCEFTDCTLIYRGGANVKISGCRFDNCKVGMEDAAERTLAMLRAIYHGFGDVGPRMIEDTFNVIRRPPEKASSAVAPKRKSSKR